MNKRAVFFNLLANLISFIVQLGISFFLTPYIVGTLSSEAYGFITLANSFPSYAQLVTAALNGMAGRFVSIEIFRKNYDEANRYFSSVVLSNVVLAAVWGIFTIIFVPNINSFLNVPDYLLHDVKILFSIIFVNFGLSLLTNLLGIAVYTENKLYLNSVRSIEALFIKSVLLVVLFVSFEPKVYYIAIGATVELLYNTAYNVYYTRKFLPFIKIKRAFFQFSKVVVLISSGIWNCISRLGGILNDGLDLLICNLLISSTEMGVLSIAKTIPAMILTIINLIANAFGPDITKNYAVGRLEDVADTIKQSMKVMGALISIPLGGLIGFGDVFFGLWVPGEDAGRLQILSILSIGLLVFTAATSTIYNVYTVTNKLKVSSVVTVIGGAVNTLFVLILLKTTKLGIYAVAGVSSIVGIFRDYLFSIPYAARCLKVKWYTFYPPALKTVLSVGVVICICWIYRYFFFVNTWIGLIVAALICGFFGFVANLYVVLNRSERLYLGQMIRKRK